MAASTFEKSFNKTIRMRDEVPSDLLPLFDHLCRLAVDSHTQYQLKKYPYLAQRAGRELLKARKLAGR